RNFALLALGGAGPLHANALAILINSWPAIIPTTPGVLSALGFLHSDIKTEFSRTFIRALSKTNETEIRRILDQLGDSAYDWLEAENIAPNQRQVNYQLDMRYYRQGYEFAIDVEPGWFSGPDGMHRAVERFKKVHYRNYAFNIDHDIEIVNLRAVAL